MPWPSQADTQNQSSPHITFPSTCRMPVAAGRGKGARYGQIHTDARRRKAVGGGPQPQEAGDRTSRSTASGRGTGFSFEKVPAPPGGALIHPSAGDSGKSGGGCHLAHPRFLLSLQRRPAPQSSGLSGRREPWPWHSVQSPPADPEMVTGTGTVRGGRTREPQQQLLQGPEAILSPGRGAFQTGLRSDGPAVRSAR